jgi:hypothetical protein
MEPFIVDFAMQRGHEMLITRDPPFKRDDMDEIDLNMLQAETIPRLLRVDWLEVDGCIQLRYSLTGKRMLAQRLAAQPIGMMDYYELLLGVIEALDECRHYLLRENCCLLDERYLFVGERWSDVWLTYVPLRDGCAKQPFHEALLGLAARWGARVTDVEGGGLQMVLKLLEAPGSTLAGIRNAMLEWMGKTEAAGRERSPASQDSLYASGSASADIPSPSPSAAVGSASGTGRQNAGSGHAARRGFDSAVLTNPLARKSGNADSAAWPFQQNHDSGGPAFRGQSHEAEAGQAELTGYLDREWRTEEGKQADASRAKWLSGALTLVVCACCWRFVYLPSPGMEQLLICTGLTLLMLWGMVTLWSKLGSKRATLPILPLEDTMPEGNSDGLLWGQPQSAADADQGRQRVMGRGAGGMEGGQGRRTDSPDSRHPIGSGYSSGVWEAESEISAASDETTLLSDASAGGQALSGGNVMREYQGQSLRIALPIGISVIGRSAEISHIVDTADGVSRTHLELEWDGRQAKARDLASRNGSLLNGAPMVPYKLYELKHTDWIQLAGTDGPRYMLQYTD